ncbi:thioredoxin family protein [Robiginitalea sp. M366]|uniref:thioredoxin family protein n=1 Tax=Robiginitalea aestuariiviva TaxID=3036903 RepID=UPI00240D629E|nr:thioredoxin family protein [Robiginitalea aestuariiviva]MDG1571250.1 thioredoxin family protein [Robiginitalea aestuariiviva]
MKKITCLLLFLITTLSLSAQEWMTDFEAAQLESHSSGKPIVLVFQGSDWCAPCIRLDREVWNTETFKAYAPEHFVMLLADFPRRKENALPEAQAQANARLAEKYNPRGYFPLVVVMDASGRVLGETGYRRLSPEAYIEVLESFIPKG